MTPAARLQAAIDILDEMNRSLVASDKFLRGWWGARRFAGSKDRAAVSERVYAVLRRRASLSWRMQSDSPRALVIASLLAEGASPTAIEGLFDGSQYGPQSLSSEEKAAIVGTPAPPPDYVCGDFPEWLDSELREHPQLVLMGDFNITVDDRDVHDPVALAGTIHCTPEERAHFQALLDLGLHDAFRMFHSEAKHYSWWDYREMAFRRNKGLRIDHVLVSTALQPLCVSCDIDKAPRKNERPSDHAPVVLALKDPIPGFCG